MVSYKAKDLNYLKFVRGVFEEDEAGEAGIEFDIEAATDAELDIIIIGNRISLNFFWISSEDFELFWLNKPEFCNSCAVIGIFEFFCWLELSVSEIINNSWVLIKIIKFFVTACNNLKSTVFIF